MDPAELAYRSGDAFAQAARGRTNETGVFRFPWAHLQYASAYAAVSAGPG